MTAILDCALAIDLFCGLGGWTDGLLAEGWDVIGFDIEQHVYGEHRYPAQLVVQDVLTLHGSQFKGADLIVASPPCQGYSYRAMPWKRAKALPPPDNSLFEACFRIQREACAAAGRHIPLIVENVRGAQKWVGRARWNYGSFYLWGDVPALMPPTFKAIKVPTMGAGWYPPGHPKHIKGLGFNTHAERNLRDDIKNTGGSWFNIAHNTTSGKGRNPDGRKVSERIIHIRDGAAHTKHLTDPYEHEVAEGRKGAGAGAAWFDQNLCQLPSNSSRRKMASAMIAKIPLPLSRHIARSFLPKGTQAIRLGRRIEMADGIEEG